MPRTLTPEQLEALDALRRQAEAQLELRANLIELARGARRSRSRRSSRRSELIEELRESLDNVNKLSGLIPYCSECQFNMMIPADPRAIPTVTDGVMQVLVDKKWPEERIMQVELALQEALANAIRHGCKGDPSRQVQCVVNCDTDGEVVIVVRDPGTGFDATHVARSARRRERVEVERPRHLPDQPVDGRSRVQGRRPRAADAQAAAGEGGSARGFGSLLAVALEPSAQLTARASSQQP